MESGVHSSLHQKYHHQIIYAKLNLKIHYPPPHKGKFGIISMQILILSKEQSSIILGKDP